MALTLHSIIISLQLALITIFSTKDNLFWCFLDDEMPMINLEMDKMTMMKEDMDEMTTIKKTEDLPDWLEAFNTKETTKKPIDWFASWNPSTTTDNPFKYKIDSGRNSFRPGCDF